ncbi:hypothetical protein BO83DRAFT_231334 [Aspergillus eucalypticola CBS 122712]|uniref:Uncharacterized protein n=1 Tax=Aspergillus eucalypticola (strain CBS 122712 / IBT 29274) TaxID=1448314 RepID=A0A317UJD4_ASPEC|nr:uncharacterized protein BO83DRAFT_28527 [Aspergillus eucalypticola CBS 122712]XP_025381764.1 uncharacterized protein BO83DRAFT_231334 [Aspergillus eucalypticola CBS 122712]PWY61429.1 hypothetical protein BO83DRAFT_28527 [Aspergillus eucalypticola CBS 122712]PWY61663.1 hypothetical protein BO83DRAFT_231334 [Aspergillus eucalypticola CBS 122712]
MKNAWRCQIIINGVTRREISVPGSEMKYRQDATRVTVEDIYDTFFPPLNRHVRPINRYSNND